MSKTISYPESLDDALIICYNESKDRLIKQYNGNTKEIKLLVKSIIADAIKNNSIVYIMWLPERIYKVKLALKDTESEALVKRFQSECDTDCIMEMPLATFMQNAMDNKIKSNYFSSGFLVAKLDFDTGNFETFDSEEKWLSKKAEEERLAEPVSKHNPEQWMNTLNSYE